MAIARPRSVFIALAAGLAAIATSALAQVKSVDPYSVTVSTDKGDLRCADLTQAYRVAQVTKGTTLLVDGEGQTGLRVAYPNGSSAFVRAEDVDFDATANTAKLNKGSKLRAAQFGTNYDFSKSWKGLLDTELPPGTELKVLETIKGTDGNATAYRIEVPASARAFISMNLVRKADGSEVTKTADVAGRKRPAPTDPKTDPKTDTKTDTTKTDGKVDPATGLPIETPTKTDGTEAAPTKPATLNPSPSITPAPKVVKPVNKLDGLESAFKNLRSQSIEEAEIEPLMNEYKAALAELPAGSRRRGQLQQRIDYLQFQRDLQDNKRKLAEIEKQADERTKNLQLAVADVERTRVYTIIGMLLPSTVYDGNNMPLMYRIQSVGGVTPRTLGYLKPDAASGENDKLDIKSKLGLIVGVIGEASIDPTMQLNVVTPVRVDPLKPATNSSGAPTLEVAPTPAKPAIAKPQTTPTTTPATTPTTVPDPEK